MACKCTAGRVALECMHSGGVSRGGDVFGIPHLCRHRGLLKAEGSRERGRIQLAGTIAVGQSLVKSAGVFSS